MNVRWDSLLARPPRVTRTRGRREGAVKGDGQHGYGDYPQLEHDVPACTMVSGGKSVNSTWITNFSTFWNFASIRNWIVIEWVRYERLLLPRTEMLPDFGKESARMPMMNVNEVKAMRPRLTWQRVVWHFTHKLPQANSALIPFPICFLPTRSGCFSPCQRTVRAEWDNLHLNFRKQWRKCFIPRRNAGMMMRSTQKVGRRIIRKSK